MLSDEDVARPTCYIEVVLEIAFKDLIIQAGRLYCPFPLSSILSNPNAGIRNAWQQDVGQVGVYRPHIVVLMQHLHSQFYKGANINYCVTSSTVKTPFLLSALTLA